MSRWPRRFRRPPGSLDDARADVDEELDFHLEQCARELEADGWAPADARAEAERRFGDLRATRDYCARESARADAEEGRRMGLDGLRQDLGYALRTLRRSPTYTLVVLLTLAVGIALDTLVFSFMNPYVLRPLPYRDAERIVHLGGVSRLEGWDLGRFSLPQLQDLRSQTSGFSEMEGYVYGGVNLVAGDEPAEAIASTWVTGGLFPLLGRDALLGRTLQPMDSDPGAAAVAVIGEDLWERRFGADPAIIGRTLRLDGRPTTVVGVLARDFNFPYNAVDLWMPVDRQEWAARSRMNLLLVGRLAPGWSEQAALQEIQAVQAGLAQAHPEQDGLYDTVTLKPLREALNFAWDILHPTFLLLLGAVSFVLVIACVNVASLTLARSGVRGREVAVRAAIGADRVRLVRQLTMEGLLLALGGGLGGVLLAVAGMRAVGGLLPGELFRVGDVSLDGRVLTFAALVSLATPLFFGLAPALATTRGDLARKLRQGSGRTGGGRGVSRGRRILVVTEVALAVVLVTGTGLMLRSLRAALSTDLGYDASGSLVVTLSPAAAAYPDAASLNAYFSEARQALASIPGVRSVGAASHLPLNHELPSVRFTTPDGLDAPLEDRPEAYTSRAEADYFAAMRIPLLAGRAFRPEDADTDPQPVVVSAGLARRLWADGEAVGRTLAYGGRDQVQRATVIGVTGDVRWAGLAGAPEPHVYRPLDGTTTHRRFLVVSAAPGALAGLTNPIRETLRRLDPELPPTIRPMTDIVHETTGVWALSSAFLGAFGLVALALAALGIYGLISFSVVQRRPEIGLRLALGAEPGALRLRIVAEGLRLTGLGVLLGGVVAVGAGMFVQSQLLGVKPFDPLTLGAAALVFSLVAAAAAFLPGRRAASMDPAEVLRAE